MNICVIDKKLYEGADWSIIDDVHFTAEFEADVLAIGLTKVIDRELVSRCPRLKYIISPTTGIDHIKDRSVPLIHLIPSEVRHIRAASEFSLLLILSLLRKSWAWGLGYGRDDLLGEDLDGKNLGILGFGRIGSNLARYAEPFGANILVYDKATGGNLKEVLNDSDIVAVCISATEDNRNFLDKEKFNMMLRCPYFVNISRGFIVDDRALLSALLEGQIKAAALDVVEDRSVYDEYKGKNLIFTPHIAGNTYQSKQKACNYVIKKLSEVC